MPQRSNCGTASPGGRVASGFRGALVGAHSCRARVRERSTAAGSGARPHALPPAPVVARSAPGCYSAPNSLCQHSGQNTCCPPRPSGSGRHSSSGCSPGRGERSQLAQRSPAPRGCSTDRDATLIASLRLPSPAGLRTPEGDASVPAPTGPTRNYGAPLPAPRAEHLRLAGPAPTWSDATAPTGAANSVGMVRDRPGHRPPVCQRCTIVVDE